MRKSNGHHSVSCMFGTFQWLPHRHGMLLERFGHRQKKKGSLCASYAADLIGRCPLTVMFGDNHLHWESFPVSQMLPGPNATPHHPTDAGRGELRPSLGLGHAPLLPGTVFKYTPARRFSGAAHESPRRRLYCNLLMTCRFPQHPGSVCGTHCFEKWASLSKSGNGETLPGH